MGSSRSTGPLAHRDGRQAGRHAQALLGAGVGDVDVPGVDLDGDAAERGDAVDEQQGVALALAEGLDVVADAGRRLGVDDGDHGGRRVGAEQRGGVERAAPGRLDPHDLGPAAAGHVAHPLAEHPVDADDDHVAGVARR